MSNKVTIYGKYISKSGDVYNTNYLEHLIGYPWGGWEYIYLFICWSSRMTTLFLTCSITPCTSKGDFNASAICHLRGSIGRSKQASACYCGGLSCNYYVSQFTVETYCFADGRCLFKQPQSVIYHWSQHDEEISKKCRSVRPSVSLSVCNANKKKPTPPSLLTVEK